MDATPYKGGRDVVVHTYYWLPCNLPGELIEQQKVRAIRNEIKRRNFIYHIPQGIRKCMTLHLHNQMTFAEIIMMAEKCEACNKEIE